MHVSGSSSAFTQTGDSTIGHNSASHGGGVYVLSTERLGVAYFVGLPSLFPLPLPLDQQQRRVPQRRPPR